MAGFRDVVVRWLGEGVARKIERFVDGTIFGEKTFLTCPQCKTPVAATLISERGACPLCGAQGTKETMIEALEARKRAAMAAGEAATKDVEEIDRQLSAMRKKD